MQHNSIRSFRNPVVCESALFSIMLEDTKQEYPNYYDFILTSIVFIAREDAENLRFTQTQFERLAAFYAAPRDDDIEHNIIASRFLELKGGRSC